jgi:hypothetical protein
VKLIVSHCLDDMFFFMECLLLLKTLLKDILEIRNEGTSAYLLIKEVLETTRDDTSGEEVCEGDTFANQVGVVLEVLLNNTDSLERSLGGIIDTLLVVRVTANKGAEPSSESRQNLSVEE